MKATKEKIPEGIKFMSNPKKKINSNCKSSTKEDSFEM